MSHDISIKVTEFSTVTDISPQPIEVSVPRGEDTQIDLEMTYHFDDDVSKLYNEPRFQVTNSVGDSSSWESGEIVADFQRRVSFKVPGYTSQYAVEVRQQAQRQVATMHKVNVSEMARPWKFAEFVCNDSLHPLHVPTLVPELDCVIFQNYYGKRSSQLSFVSFQVTGDDPENIPVKEVASPSRGVVRLAIGRELSIDKNYQIQINSDSVPKYLIISTKPSPEQRVP